MFREKLMRPDQDWESVWPAMRTFHPASVPLPIRQGFIQLQDQVHPSKWTNVELMKIPNFLHLTPPVVRKHCALLKDMCTAFPSGDVARGELSRNENALACEFRLQYCPYSIPEFPMNQSTSTYLNASSSIRDHRARVVSIKVFIDDLVSPELAKDPQRRRHFEDKLIRLVGGGRYNPMDHSITIVADSCPYSWQVR